MQNRRDFLKTATLAAIGSGLGIHNVFAGKSGPALFSVNKLGKGGRMKMRFFPYELKLKHVFTVASYSRTTTPDVQVEIEYEGVAGYGEASMPPYLGQTVDTVMAFLRKVDLEQFSDPFGLEDILAYVDSLSPGDTAAKAAVDIALHDLVGKLLGAPWYKIWGLNKEKTPSTTFTIGIDTPDVVRGKTREVAGQFNILKVKLGRDNDKEMIRTIRSVSALPIAVDANQGWSDRQYALDMIHWLKEQGIVMIEQPMPKEQLDDIAWITQQSPLPVFADESLQRLNDVTALKGAFTGINIKLMKCTGMREAWKMVTLARALDMKVMVGCMTETSCAVSAAAQLSPVVDFADLDGNLLISNDRFKGMEVINGKITLNDLPGIGVDLIM
ncbi:MULTISPECIES: dipeptide epimerase [Bacteroides]|uniref:dipeptide epimerase n=1 Tax=Bacteroides TaxID=816 RepID=UPI00034153A0|nr:MULTISPECIES: dipeptide epimerase [Bacteroides]UYU45278.1 dipeptide epimerase [Bacteroides salyersiae]CCY51221.1 tat (Twin-arginine translocation) pathway signal sequence [Bacteroides sp. CAG:189]